MASFSAQVDDWVRKTEQRMLAVFRTATEFVIEDVKDRTPVDTGFLRASMQASINTPLPIKAGNRPDSAPFPVDDISLTIAGANLSDTIYGSFTAEYAGYVEYGARGRPGKAMVRLAAQNWQQHVNRAVGEAKARVSRNYRTLS